MMLLMASATAVLRGQTSKMEMPATTTVTNIDRYKVDYEIKNISNPSNELLMSLNLSQYEELRLDVNDLEISDEENNVVIILYSNQKAGTNKKNTLRNSQHNEETH